MSESKNTIRKPAGLLPLAVALLLAVPLVSLAQEHAGHAMGQEMKMPQTADDHRKLAEQYDHKAAEARADIAAHKKMLAEFSKRVAQNPKTTTENPYLRKMRLHCEKYIRATEAMAREADAMAQFHRFRAREVEGK
jgi:hypothetical protein